MEERGGWRRGEKKTHSHLRGSKAFNHLTSEASQCPARAASPRPPAPPLQSRKSKQSREVCRGHFSIDAAVLMLFHCSRRTLRVTWLRIPVNVSFICLSSGFLNASKVTSSDGNSCNASRKYWSDVSAEERWKSWGFEASFPKQVLPSFRKRKRESFFKASLSV